MNNNSKLPNKLWRAKAELKAFLEKMALGVSLESAIKKVGILSTLNRKERETLVSHMAERESVHVVWFVPVSSYSQRPDILHLQMKRFGEPLIPSGYQMKHSPEQVQAAPEPAACERFAPVMFEPIESFKKQMDESAQEIKNPTPKEVIPVAPRTIAPAGIVVKSASQLRKEAEELIRQAEETERAAEQSDFFKKRLSPIKLEMLQATNTIRQHLDGLIDGMAALEKAGDKLKELTA